MIRVTKENICAAVTWTKAYPERIINGDLAQDEDGKEVDTLSPKACCFCILGAIMREAGINTDSTGIALTALQDSFPEIEHTEINKIWRENDDGIATADALRGTRYVGELFQC